MTRRLVGTLAATLLLTGCTSQSWYDAFQMEQRRQCSAYSQQYEVQRCLERVNALTYDQYKRQTEALKERQ